eukprot:SAG22_NODE_142_length_17922_cov_10.990406_11_plen_129_part_00
MLHAHGAVGADIQTLKANVAKASAMGIECGGYDLTVLDRGHRGYGGNVGDEWDRVGPDGVLSREATVLSFKCSDHCLSLWFSAFLAVPLLSQRTVAISGRLLRQRLAGQARSDALPRDRHGQPVGRES